MPTMDGRNLAETITNTVFSRPQIEEKTAFIHDRVLSKSAYLACTNFRAIHTDDLARLFDYYDDLFFEGQFGAVARANGNHL